MLMNQTISKLNGLRLNAMAKALELQRDNPQLQELPFEERFSMLVDHETQARDTRRVTSAFRIWPKLQTRTGCSMTPRSM